MRRLLPEPYGEAWRLGRHAKYDIDYYKDKLDALFEAREDHYGSISGPHGLDGLNALVKKAEEYVKKKKPLGAATIYQAIIEAIIERYGKIDDSYGTWGDELKRAIRALSKVLKEANLDFDIKEEYLEDLFVRAYLDESQEWYTVHFGDALRELCQTENDWLYIEQLVLRTLPLRMPLTQKEMRKLMDDSAPLWQRPKGMIIESDIQSKMHSRFVHEQIRNEGELRIVSLYMDTLAALAKNDANSERSRKLAELRNTYNVIDEVRV